jgi:5-methylcytosine-specific restriction endonuclease McrA
MKPSVIRDICGTDSGYRKHRRMDEERCQPCKDAHNIVRKNTYNPDKSKQYADKYREPSRVEAKKRKEALIKERAAKKVQKRTEIEKRKEARKKAGIAYKKERERRRIAHAKKLANTEKRREEERKAIAQRKKDAKIKRDEKRQAKELKAQALKDAQKAKREEKERIAAERTARQETLNNQHGTTPGDYTRCRKNNKVACELCKAIAAKYVRDKFKDDPKYKEAEKRWKKANPHKVAASSRDRARNKGVKSEYYTRQQLFDRDGYECYICNIPVDLEAAHVQGQPGWEMYPHVEHVIPIALGGEDTLANVKIAHAKCNISKGTRLLPQT